MGDPPAAHPSLQVEGALLERTIELDALSRALAAARRGAGELVLVDGPAGIGKSRLLGAACDEGAREGMGILRAAGLELERDVPFGVAAQLFEGRLASAGPAAREQLLSGQAALAGFLLDPMRAASGDPQGLVRGLYWLTVNLSSPPLVIALDDAQWADRRSLAFLAHLAARLGDLPVALLLAVRTGETSGDGEVLGALRERATLLAPARLSDAAVGYLVDRDLPDAHPSFVEACARVSGGNPFLASELARALREDDVPPTASSVARVERLVPASVLHSLLARLGRLGEIAQQLASAVAVLGDGTPLRRAATLAGLDGRGGEEAADALAQAGIFGVGEPLRFAHPLIATAVYSDMAAFARARAHRAAAGLLAHDAVPVQEVAAHLLLTRPEVDPWVVHTLRDAARRSLSQGDPHAAAAALTRALAEPPAADERADVLVELAEAEVLVGLAAEERVIDALTLLDTGAERIRALRTLSRIRLVQGDHAAAADGLLEVLDSMVPGDPRSEQVLAEYLTVNSFDTSLSPRARVHLDPLVRAASRGDLPSDPGLLCHLALRIALDGGSPETVRRLSDRATAEDPLVGLGTYGMFMGIAVQGLCSVDELDLAESITDRALEVAHRSGSLFASATVSYHRAIGRFHRGALADALADLDQAQGPFREGWSAGSAWWRSLQAHVQLERGAVEAARDVLASPAPPDESMDHAIVQFARARLALADRDPAAALARATDAGRHLDGGFGIDHAGFLPWRRTAAVAALALERRELAELLAHEDMQRARAIGVPRAIAIALRTRAGLVDEVTRLELLQEAASTLAESPSMLERAHVLADLGGALRRSRRTADAQAVLRQALQLADGMGAAPLAELARLELRATGARPRRSAFTGVDALTSAERRVSQLAARGLTNRQIAEELFVSTKTVQTQLSHAFRKLDIASRRELAPLLGGRRPP